MKNRELGLVLCDGIEGGECGAVGQSHPKRRGNMYTCS